MFSHKKISETAGLQRAPATVNYQFPSRSPPDITSNTRIIAVCGISNVKVSPTSQRGWASPQEDGWFWSDFFMLHHLLSGFGASQKWMACASPQQLVAQYEEYLHGNPFEERKVVIDRSIHGTGKFSDIAVSNPSLLRSDFLQALQAECNEARRLDQTVLVIINAHGDYDSKGVYIGGLRYKDPAAIITPEQFSETLGVKDLQVCLMSTACFSGGWTMRPDILNITAATAVDEEEQSESWPMTKSMGRACGSIFTSALLTTSDQLDENSSTAYHDYAKTVIDVCTYHTDRLAESTICFSSQDDNWELDYKTRTGVPLDAFRQRWNLLHGVPPTYDNPSLNRDATTWNSNGSRKPVTFPGALQHDDSEKLYEEYNVDELSRDDPLRGMRGSLRGRFGGSREDALANFRRFVKDKADLYQSCYPGKPNVPSNSHLQTLLRDVEVLTEITYSQLDAALTQISYRMDMMDQANRLCRHLKMVGLPRCQVVNLDVWQRDNASNAARIRDYKYAKQEISKHEVFGTPTTEQGREFWKPVEYLAACMVESGWRTTEIDNGVVELERCKTICISELQGMVEVSAAVDSKKRKFTESLRGFMQGMSPKRHREN